MVLCDEWMIMRMLSVCTCVSGGGMGQTRREMSDHSEKLLANQMFHHHLTLFFRAELLSFVNEGKLEM